MNALYLICLVVGAGLLLVSLFGGDADADFDGDLDLDIDSDVPDGVELESEGAPSHAGGVGWSVARDFFSVRSLFYFFAGFGATGFLLENFTTTPAAWVTALALVTGLLGAAAAGAVYGSLRRSESGIVPRDSDYLVGQPAEVIFPVGAERRGKIRVLAGNREIELLARLHSRDDAECPRGATVVVVDIDGDTALVASAPSLRSGLL